LGLIWKGFSQKPSIWLQVDQYRIIQGKRKHGRTYAKPETEVILALSPIVNTRGASCPDTATFKPPLIKREGGVEISMLTMIGPEVTLGLKVIWRGSEYAL
jgi:hypothetical protein